MKQKSGPLSVFGEWLRKKRYRKGMTLRDLSEKSGLNLTTLVKWEKGRIWTPRISKIKQLAVALELSPETIFEVIDDSKKILERMRVMRLERSINRGKNDNG